MNRMRLLLPPPLPPPSPVPRPPSSVQCPGGLPELGLALVMRLPRSPARARAVLLVGQAPLGGTGPVPLATGDDATDMPTTTALFAVLQASPNAIAACVRGLEGKR